MCWLVACIRCSAPLGHLGRCCLLGQATSFYLRLLCILLFCTWYLVVRERRASLCRRRRRRRRRHRHWLGWKHVRKALGSWLCSRLILPNVNYCRPIVDARSHGAGAGWFTRLHGWHALHEIDGNLCTYEYPVLHAWAGKCQFYVNQHPIFDASRRGKKKVKCSRDKKGGHAPP